LHCRVVEIIIVMRVRVCVVFCALLTGSLAVAQSARQQVWIVDPSGGAIPNAEIVVLIDGVVAAELMADARGGIEIMMPAAGPAHIVITAPGFATVEQDLPGSRGPLNPIIVTLPLAAITDNLVVAGTAELAGGSATTSLTGAELALLPDDDEALLQMLEELAGPGADVRVDGFSGGRLPTREQILRITIRRDAYSAEFEQPGQGRVDILTRPAAERWRTSASFNVRPSSWSAPNAMAKDTGQGTQQRFNASVGGPLVRNRTSLFLEGSIGRSEDSRAISAVLTSGPYVTAVQQPGRDGRFSARVESLIGRSTLARVTWWGEASTRDNQGLSELDLPERGYERTNREHNVRLSVDGGPSRPYYVRLNASFDRSEIVPDLVAPATVVNNAFRSGGASQSGEDRTRQLEIETAWTLLAKPFTLRTGAQLEWVRDHQGVIRNALGTFTFSNLPAYEAGIAANYSRRIGAEPLDLDTLQVGPFVQADVQVRNWSIGLGLRYQAQTHLDDAAAFSPRLGATRSFNRNRTTIRMGVGSYYGWLPTNVWEENVRLGRDSEEREILIRNPGFPDPGAGGEEAQRDPPTSVTLVPAADLTRWTRASFGISHQLPHGFRLNGDVYRLQTSGEWRSVDLNVPVDGVRPNSNFGRVLLVDSRGKVTDWGFGADLNFNNQRARVFGNARYQFGRRWNDGDDALTPPPDGRSFDTEWGPARNDQGHRLFWMIGTPIRWGVQTSLSGRVTPGSRYNVTTGIDSNGDAYFTERPDGVMRNSRRGDVQLGTDVRISWRPAMLQRGGDGPRGQRGPGGGQGGPGGGPNAARPPERTFELFLYVSNAFNRVNYTSYVGNLTSQLFGEPTSAGAARRVETGLRLSY
jgi:hypothetical protein